MTIGLCFWVLYIVAIVFSAWGWRDQRPMWGPGILTFVLLGLLGWHAFGPPIH